MDVTALYSWCFFSFLSVNAVLPYERKKEWAVGVMMRSSVHGSTRGMASRKALSTSSNRAQALGTLDTNWVEFSALVFLFLCSGVLYGIETNRWRRL